MLTFIKAGGWPMLVVLVLSAVALVVAVRFMLEASAARKALLETLARAIRYITVGGVASNLVAVAWNTTTRDELRDSPDFHKIVIYGIGEALTPAVLAYTALGLAWVMVAVGTRRATDIE